MSGPDPSIASVEIEVRIVNSIEGSGLSEMSYLVL